MRHIFILLFAALPFTAFSASDEDSVRVDTLKEVEVQGDSVLRVNDAIKNSIGRENELRIGYPSVSDVLGPRITDKIMHPFAIKDRRRDKKHARDRKILEEYEQLYRVKTFEELLDEAIRQQAIEDGKEPPKQSGKKK
ncbi:MAG: hypothetical protein IJS63_12340 [Bacteroidaceae bacterium]|nr:hypothetical protein [Bacteroidaceae bacterium]